MKTWFKDATLNIEMPFYLLCVFGINMATLPLTVYPQLFFQLYVSVPWKQVEPVEVR